MTRQRGLLAVAAVAGLAGVIVLVFRWWPSTERGDPRLRQYVLIRPAVPIVFTSRSEPASLVAPAAEGEGYHYPGQHLWAAREGRLRLLTPEGSVVELTWNRTLPDGSTLIDVMSPSVSLDGRRILFAGRKGGDDPGRFRLYEIGIDGSNLRPLTGGPDDEGCTAAPPLRWGPDGSPMPESERRQLDYDDVDPIELNFADRRILFVSSRTPDLGRDHARRSTTLWLLLPDGSKQPVSANRNNDRWPFLFSSGYTAFSLWSRNREVISADRTDIEPFDGRKPSASQPTDSWFAAFVQVGGGHFGMMLKPEVPVWRPRPLFINRIAFMTSTAPGRVDPNDLTVVQAEPGLINRAPSSAAPEAVLPKSDRSHLRWGPRTDAQGQPIALATPSPAPPRQVLLAGRITAASNSAGPRPTFALYIADDDWPASPDPASAEAIGLKLLFDDPDLEDAEPVAVYPRDVALVPPPPSGTAAGTPPREIRLWSGRSHTGPFGALFATQIDAPTAMASLPGNRTDVGQGPIFDSPPTGSVDRIRIYAAYRDRFDHPTRPRVPGDFARLLEVPVRQGVASTWLPTDAPTVLAGFGPDGRVVQWTTAARDRAGHAAVLYAFAGDHYSLTTPGGRHFCLGCHPGHSGLSRDDHWHVERRR